MSGTKSGAIKTKQTMIKKLGSEAARLEFFRVNGSLGGKVYNVDAPKGFALLKKNGQTDKIRLLGALGGSKSTRAGVKNGANGVIKAYEMKFVYTPDFNLGIIKKKHWWKLW